MKKKTTPKQRLTAAQRPLCARQAGRHRNRSLDVAKGRSRKPKHRKETS